MKYFSIRKEKPLIKILHLPIIRIFFDFRRGTTATKDWEKLARNFESNDDIVNPCRVCDTLKCALTKLCMVGTVVGCDEGCRVGCWEGWLEGWLVGCLEG